VSLRMRRVSGPGMVFLLVGPGGLGQGLWVSRPRRCQQSRKALAPGPGVGDGRGSPAGVGGEFAGQVQDPVAQGVGLGVGGR
jgi:hypothetical protein